MAHHFDLLDPGPREAGLAAAVQAVRRGQLIILPTDTVYGVGVDAFDPDGVQRLLDSKGRGRDMPPPVLISTTTTLDALATDLPGWVAGLVERYWPGPLTLVCRQQPSLRWDLGDTRGTVAVRMPDHEQTLELLTRTGPLAVSSANTHGLDAATTIEDADDMLGWAVEVLLDGGPSNGSLASSIVDCTDERPRLLREGVLTREELGAALEELGTRWADEPDDEPEDEPEDQPVAEPEDPGEDPPVA